MNEDQIYAIGGWLVAIILIIGAIVLAALGHGDAAGTCIGSLVFLFFLLGI